MNKAILILLALAAVQASATDVNICDTGVVDTTSVTIVGCAKPPCMLKRGSMVSYTVKFTPSSPISDLTGSLKASRFGISISFFDRAPACGQVFKASDNSPAPCPLSSGVEYIFKNTIPVPKRPPANRGIVRGSLNSGSTTVICIEFDVKIR